MMIQKRPKGEALEASPPANGRPAGGVQGGQRPPAQHHPLLQQEQQVFYNLKNLNNLNNINITAAGAVDRELLYIELGDLFPPQHQQQQQQRTTTTTTIISGTFVCRNRTWGRTGGRAGACARAGGHARAGQLFFYIFLTAIYMSGYILGVT